MTDDKRYLGLEALRFLSAVAVLLWHYRHFYMGSVAVFVVPFTPAMLPLQGVLKPFYSWGYMAVSIFWMLSGFIFFWKYHDDVADGRVGAFEFFIRRFSRLYPLHFLTLLAVAALQAIFASGHGGETFVYQNFDLRHFALNLFFASAWGAEAGMSFNGPIWSVSIEVLIYALFFVVSAHVRCGLIGRLVVSALACAAWIVNEELFQSDAARTLLACGVFFFGGGVVHAVVELPSSGSRRATTLLAFAAAIAIAVLTFRDDVTTPPLVVVPFAALLLYGFLGIDGWRPVHAFFGRLAPLADLTYSSYLVHFPIQIVFVMVTDRLGYGRTVYDDPRMLVAFLATVFATAWWVSRRFERPAQSWIRRLASTRLPRIGPAER